MLKKIVNSFEANLDKVETLLLFDAQIRELCLKGLKKAKKGLEVSEVNNPHFSVDREIEIIEKLRLDGFLKRNYLIMYNQCIVLMVSYFSSTLEDIFKAAFHMKLTSSDLDDLESEEFKITLGELLYDNDLAEMFVQKKKDINFQDMQSTLRSFNKYIGLPIIKRDGVIDNIILAQAMRHCIVHNGCIINDKTMSQVDGAEKTTFKKTNIIKGECVQFSEEGVRQIKDDMLSFVKLIANKISETLDVFETDTDTYLEN